MSRDADTQHKIDAFANNLAEEFAEQFQRDEVSAMLEDSLARLTSDATIGEFVPLMAYRFTRERLLSLARAAHREQSDGWDFVYVSVSGGGRGQLAAALTTRLAGDRVSVHSAGTAPRAIADPGVRAVLEEIGVDPDSEFARPVTDEVLRAADVVVTMGSRVVGFDIPPEVRHEDWRVGDPIGAPLDEVRRIRDDIERRVRALLADLGVAAGEPVAAAAN